jgi:rfaE bifunctional protein nucleotidyltransferase chain/domain
MRDPLKKILPLASLVRELDKLRAEGKTIVTTNGCFDLLHWGHIQYLHQARALGDCLVVLINADASVRSLKGPQRPIQNESVRLKQMAGLESVDYVCLFSEKTPEQALSSIRPHIHCKGGDYEPDALPETAVVRKNGGQVRCLSLAPGISTSALIERILEAQANQH